MAICELLGAATGTLVEDPVKAVMAAIDQYNKLFSGDFRTILQTKLISAERAQLGATLSSEMKIHIDHVVNCYPCLLKG